MNAYRWSIIAAGGVIIVFALEDWFRSGFHPEFWVLAIFTAIAGSKVEIRLSRYNGIITVSDIFPFLALLWWGGSAAVLIAVVEQIAATSRVGRRWQTFAFNASLATISISVTASILTAIFAVPTDLATQLPSGRFVTAVGLMGLTHYVFSLTQISVLQFLKMKLEVWLAWLKHFCLWSCVTFFIAAAAAATVVKIFGKPTLVSILVVAPIILLLYLTYRTYIRNFDALQESEGRFRSSFDYATVGMALVSPDGNWLKLNHSLRELLGRGDELINAHYNETMHPDDAEKIEAQVIALLSDEIPTFQSEVRLFHSSGETVWSIVSASVARDAQGTIRYLIWQTQDVTQRKQAEASLLHEATHDALTGLLNRAAYGVLLKTALEASKSKSQLIAVLFLDLDGFKLVNDSLGHVAGDELLKFVAARLGECVRPNDAVARLGGDEFTILLENIENVPRAVNVAERIRQRLSEPFDLSGQEIFIGTSIGVATSDIYYVDPSEMLRDADAAMYHAKGRGRNCFVLFDREMHSNATKQLRLANDLRRAAERGEFVLHYQVMQDLESHEITGFEALIRWEHPHYGLIPPNDFIPLAEEHNLTNTIDEWVLREACRQLRAWQLEDSANDNLMISVNIATRQFAQNGLCDLVEQVMRETGLDAKCLQLEITESAMMKSLQKTAKILADLHRSGVTIALDDFGTGYSSLSYLHELPIDTLKIDRSFINRINDKADGAAIVRAIIVLARTLRIKVVAEGIENLDQLHHLQQMNCDFGQGYLLSRPIPALEAHKLLLDQPAISGQLNRRSRKQLRLVSGS